jgi:hypothetical protein
MITLNKFISQYYIEKDGKYFSRYDIVELGLTYQSVVSHTKEELVKEYEAYGRRPDYWLEEYKWNIKRLTMKAQLYKLKEGYVLCSDKKLNFNYNESMSFDDFLNVLSNNPDFSELKEEDAKRIGWFDLDKYVSFLDTPESLDQYSYDMGIVHGFKKALELTADRRFTEEDVLKVIEMAIKFRFGRDKHDYTTVEFQNTTTYIFNYLSQPKSWEVIVSEENGVYKITKIL